jgi:HAD superfamily hydrolase (TIGR01509 family)
MHQDNAIGAVIFDFNGTLFNDTEFHNEAWTRFALQHGKKITPEAFDKHIHGSTNREILEYLFGRTFQNKALRELYEQKESIYRELCHTNSEQIRLTQGAESFLDLLAFSDIPRTIATASYAPNVSMYFELFKLARWFEFNKLILDTGEYRGKPFPDMFLAAADTLNIPIRNCMIIEDSLNGLQAAHHAGAGQIIAADFGHQPEKFVHLPFISQIISDFREIKYP